MTTENDFLPFATGGGANVIDQPTYAAASYVPNGRGSGILPSNVYNKIARQGSIGAAMLAQFIVNQLNQNVLDNGNLTTLVSQLTAAIQSAGGTKPGRVVGTFAAGAIALTDYYIWFNRTGSPGPTVMTLPGGAVPGQTFELIDIGQNANQYPISVSGVSQVITIPTLNRNYGTLRIAYVGSNLWSGTLS